MFLAIWFSLFSHVLCLFLLNTLIHPVSNKGKISRCCSLRPMIVHSSCFFNPLCGRAVVQPEKTTVACVKTSGMIQALWPPMKNTHTHQNHCQQKTFNLIFKKKLKKPTQKAYSKTYLELDTIDVWHSCTSWGRVVSTMLVPFHKISKWRQGDHVVPISPPPAPVQQRSQHH